MRRIGSLDESCTTWTRRATMRRGLRWSVTSDRSTRFVFTTTIGTPIDPDNCSRLVRAAMKRAGVCVVRLHDLRHGCVSALLGLGVPPRTVMEIAGHTAL